MLHISLVNENSLNDLLIESICLLLCINVKFEVFFIKKVQALASS